VNQEAFEARHESEWREFERWLDAQRARGRKPGAEAGPEMLSEQLVPHRYRTLCQHLALARDRQYSPGLVERLNQLVTRGHQFLYGAHPETGPAVLRFFTRDFARRVRAEWRALACAAVLFFLPLTTVAVAIQAFPDFVHTLLNDGQLSGYQEMYDSANKTPGRRSAQSDTFMLGHYIWNNIRIGFQTFAGGLLFGLGTVFFLVVNGLLIGATAGHLVHLGYTETFFGFVAGHSALELTGIVLMGAAGLKLGAALIMPGEFARGAALRLAARRAVPLVYGAGALLTAAAFVEAFWSPVNAVPTEIKYATGILMWILLACYFIAAGRDHAA